VTADVRPEDEREVPISPGWLVYQDRHGMTHHLHHPIWKPDLAGYAGMHPTDLLELRILLGSALMRVENELEDAGLLGRYTTRRQEVTDASRGRA